MHSWQPSLVLLISCKKCYVSTQWEAAETRLRRPWKTPENWRESSNYNNNSNNNNNDDDDDLIIIITTLFINCKNLSHSWHQELVKTLTLFYAGEFSSHVWSTFSSKLTKIPYQGLATMIKVHTSTHPLFPSGIMRWIKYYSLCNTHTGNYWYTIIP